MRTNAEQPVFVETTILIKRRTGTHEQKRRIDRNLAERFRISSTYVKAEYTNTFLRATVEVYNCVVMAEDLGEVPGLWNQQRGGFRTLGLEILWLFARNDHTKDDVLARLQTLIEDDIPLWFEFMVDELTDMTRCQAATYMPMKVGETFEWDLQFPPKHAPDGLREFLSRQRGLLEQLHDRISSESREWQTVKRAIARVLANNPDTVGVRGWQALGDTIIALEAKASGGAIYTTNLRHFQPICDAIGACLHQEIS